MRAQPLRIKFPRKRRHHRRTGPRGLLFVSLALLSLATEAGALSPRGHRGAAALGVVLPGARHARATPASSSRSGI